MIGRYLFNASLLLQYRLKELFRLYNHALLHCQVVGKIKGKVELRECAFKVENMSPGWQWWEHNIYSIIDTQI